MAEELKAGEAQPPPEVAAAEAMMPPAAPIQEGAISWYKYQVQVLNKREVNRPTPRSGHTLTVIGAYAYLFGGLHMNEPFKQVSLYDMKPMKKKKLDLHYAVEETKEEKAAREELKNKPIDDKCAEANNDVYTLKLNVPGGMEWTKVKIDPDDKLKKIDVEMPMGRWKHTANEYESNIIIFGGFHSQTHRLNDFWIYDTFDARWLQPNREHNKDNEKEAVLSSKFWEGVPSPRGSHSATIIDTNMYVFGGYGGYGHSRRDLNDVHVLDLLTYTWSRLKPKGSPPEKRSGHQACKVEGNIFILGGTSNSNQLQDVFVLNLPNGLMPFWSQLSCNLPEPVWNFSATSVMALPTWKVIIFGGVTGVITEESPRGIVRNEVYMLDLDAMRWRKPAIEGKRPAPRYDSTLSYDSSGSRLVVCGGFAAEWMSDLYTLDIGSIVGPSYAITDIHPKIGPITGGTSVAIMGIDFPNSQDVVVRFGNNKFFTTVSGVFVTKSRISCISPDFSKFPSGNYEVRVAMDGDGFTVSSQIYTFFAVAHHQFCIMFGAGLLGPCAINEEVSFIIQGRDDKNENRTTGGDEFKVSVTLQDGGDSENARITGIQVSDWEDGRHQVTFLVKYPGRYVVSVDFMGTFGGFAGPVRGTGTVVEFDTNAPRDNNSNTGRSVMAHLRDTILATQTFLDEMTSIIFGKYRDDSWTPDEQVKVLMNIKEALLSIEKRAGDVNYSIDKSDCTIRYLQEQDVSIPGLESSLRYTKDTWAKVLREGPQIQNKVTPMMRAHSQKIKEDIEGYEVHIRNYMDELMAGEYFKFATGFARSIELLDVADFAHKNQEDVGQKMIHVAHLFDCQREVEDAAEVLSKATELLKDLRTLWLTIDNVTKVIDELTKVPFMTMDAGDFEDTVKNLIQKMRKLPPTVKASDAYSGIECFVKDFINSCPSIVSLRDQSVKERHWREIMEVLGKTFTLPSKNPNMQVKDFLDFELHKYIVEIEEITQKAKVEFEHDEILKKLERAWFNINFTMYLYNGTDLPYVQVAEEVTEQIESDQLLVQGVLASKYSHFKREASEWLRALGMISEVLAVLTTLQRIWGFLEPLFIGSEEFKKELPDDSRRFEEIDAKVREFFTKAWKVKNIKTFCMQGGLVEKLTALVARQDECRASLSEYLGQKRRQFSRFYFVSELDMLDILSGAADPLKTMRHVRKVALSTASVVCEKDRSAAKPSATKFVSALGREVVEFDPIIKLAGNADVDLQSILLGQNYSLSKYLSACLARLPQSSRNDWVMKKLPTSESADPAQVLLLVAQIDNVRLTETALDRAKSDSKSLLSYYEHLVEQISDLMKLNMAPLNSGDRLRVASLIIIDTHNRDVAFHLDTHSVQNSSDFLWQCKLRPYYSGSNAAKPLLSSSVSFRLCEIKMEYGFEYVGHSNRLVVTPLTDRVYMSIFQALGSRSGVVLLGPSGTGKSETIRDLATTLGRAFYAINIIAEMTSMSIAGALKGLIGAGAWGCLEGLDRLSPDTFSVLLGHLKDLYGALRIFEQKDAATHDVSIVGEKVPIDASFGLFFTITPLQRDIGPSMSFQCLGEEFKSLVRPLAVSRPDTQAICESMLASGGFITAKELASKTRCLFECLEHQVCRDHYDWGLRNIKSILSVAGKLKRSDSELNEEEVLMRALRDFNIPRLLPADEPTFLQLLNDIFPGSNPPRQLDTGLTDSISVACDEAGLWPEPLFVQRILQLDELLDLRRSVFLLGPAGAGKSECWKMLKSARNLKPENSGHVDAVVIDPRALPSDRLFGYIDTSTREWKEGLLPLLLREPLVTVTAIATGAALYSSPSKANTTPAATAHTATKFVILDGEVDASWADGVLSLLDDCRMLTVASNERILLGDSVKIIFEVGDLSNSTPALVSRAGVVHIGTAGGNQWRSLLGSWVRSRPESLLDDVHRDQLHDFVERYVPEVLKYMSAVRGVVPTTDQAVAQSLLRLFSSIITRNLVMDKSSFEHAFVFALVWAAGSFLSLQDDGFDQKKGFSDWFKLKFKTVRLPPQETIFDYYLDLKTIKFEPWKNSPSFRSTNYDPNLMTMAETFIPCNETASVIYWSDLLASAGHAILYAGPGGTGKTRVAREVLSLLAADTYTKVFVKLSYLSTAALVLPQLEESLQKKGGGVLGVLPLGSRLAYFIDDMHLPRSDDSVQRLLRHHLDHKGWRDLGNLSRKTVEDTQYIACVNALAPGGRLCPRLLRHFMVFAVNVPGLQSLLSVFMCFLDGHFNFNGFNAEVKGISRNLVEASLLLHRDIAASFRRTPATYLYDFGLNHICQLFQGLLLSGASGFTKSDKFICLWLHELERVYCDRLQQQKDRDKFTSLCLAKIKNYFPAFDLQSYYPAEAPPADAAPAPTVFCHFHAGVDNTDTCSYNQPATFADLRVTLDEALREYNASQNNNVVMELILFTDAICHLARISRVLKQPSGHMMIMGSGGLGRRSLTRLAAFVCECALREIKESPTYSIADFKNDLKDVFRDCGMKREQVCLLVTEAQMKDDNFYACIDELISRAQVTGLFFKDEIDSICGLLANKAKGAGYGSGSESVWAYFTSLVRDNLHVVFCFSPERSAFASTYWSRYPSLTSCLTVNWVNPWPQSALVSIAQSGLAGIRYNSENTGRSVEHFVSAMYEAVAARIEAYNGATEGACVALRPRSFLDMMALYRALLARKRSGLDLQVERLKVGVETLVQAEADVRDLEANLENMILSVDKKREVAEEMKRIFDAENSIVEREVARTEVEAKIVADCHVVITTKQADCIKAIEAGEIPVIKADSALESIDRVDLGSCKALLKAPSGVDEVFAAVMTLLAGVSPAVVLSKGGIVSDKDKSFEAAKTALLGNVNGFIEELKAFKVNIDERAVPAINFKEVRQYVALPNFVPEVIERRSACAAALCTWVIHIVQYYDVILQCEPGRKALAAAEDKLKKATESFELFNARLETMKAKLQKLRDEYDSANNAFLEAERYATTGRLRLELARRLTAALGSEKYQWKDAMIRLMKSRDALIGDCLLAAAFVSYLGPLPQPLRDDTVRNLFVPQLQIPPTGFPVPLSADIEALDVICPYEISLEYEQQGLCPDSYFLESASIMDHSERFVLVVDPQAVALQWIRQKYKAKSCKMRCTAMGHPNLLQELVASITEGGLLLVEGAGERVGVDPVLMPVITRSYKQDASGSKVYALAGDVICTWNAKFKLILHSKLDNPYFTADVQAAVTTVSFAVNGSAAEQLLLVPVVASQNAFLSKQRQLAVGQLLLLNARAKRLEDKILSFCSDPKAKITENREVIDSVEQLKEASKAVSDAVDATTAARGRIDASFDSYRPASTRAALLYALVGSLPRLNPYYRLSFAAFSQCLQRALRGTDPTEAEPFEEVEDEKEENLDDDEEEEEDAVVDDTADIEPGMTPDEVEEVDSAGEDLHDSLLRLKASITYFVFDLLRCGMFERDRMTALLLLTMRLMFDGGYAGLDYSVCVRALLLNRAAEESGGRGSLSEWLGEKEWARIKALEADLPACFTDLGSKISYDSELWRQWYEAHDPEQAIMPSMLQEHLDDLQKLLFIRAIRPDRVPAYSREFVRANIDADSPNKFLDVVPYARSSILNYASSKSPLLLLVGEGVDPTGWVTEKAKSKNLTIDNGRFAVVHMGDSLQQRERAEMLLEKLGRLGGWLLLQAVHVSAIWLGDWLVPFIETRACSLHPNFRLILIAVQTGSAQQQLPLSLLQHTYRQVCEQPSDLRGLLQKSFRTVGGRAPPSPCELSKEDYTACIFGLAFFHSLTLRRRQVGFAAQGGSFGCGPSELAQAVQFFEGAARGQGGKKGDSGGLQWGPTRRVIADAIYGGYLFDENEVRGARAYLEVILSERLGACPVAEIMSSLTAPITQTWDSTMFENKVLRNVLPDNSPMYPLSINHEPYYSTENGTSLITGLYTAAPVDGTAATAKEAAGAGSAVDDMLRNCPNAFDLKALSGRSTPLISAEPHGPFIIAFAQEIIKLNGLIDGVKEGLTELRKYLNGQISTNVSVELLAECVCKSLVPIHWQRHSWASRKDLSAWFADLVLRHRQLYDWTGSATLATPKSIWLPGLASPVAMMTALKQAAAKKAELTLDLMRIDSHVSAITSEYAEFDAPAEGMLLVHGMHIYAARLTSKEDGDEAFEPYDRGGTACGGVLADLPVRAGLVCSCPALLLAAVPAAAVAGDPAYIYECPVYTTTQRGCLLMTVSLRCREPAARWLMKGVALFLQPEI